MGVPLYRGKEIGGRRQLTETCLRVLREGAGRDLYSVLPHICLLRSECFLQPLTRRLRSNLPSDQLFAAVALGSLGDRRAVAPLQELFMRPSSLRGPGCQSLQTAVIFALGETGSDEAIDPLLKILRMDMPRDPFSLRRRKLVIMALGTLAQHGSQRALGLLLEATRDARAALRGCAVSELGVAFWHCPNQVPEWVWDRMTTLLDDRAEEVREAAASALENLAQLGSRWKEAVFGA